MTPRTADALKDYGIDLADAMDRFGGNIALFERLALKYLEDDHYVKLIAALQMDDFAEGYRQAHSLKGVAGNLSFTTLYNVAAEIAANLREGEYAAAVSFVADVTRAHERVIQALEMLQNESR